MANEHTKSHKIGKVGGASGVATLDYFLIFFVADSGMGAKIVKNFVVMRA